MIKKDLILNLISDQLKAEGLFLVDLKISKTNKITVFVDGINGVSIEQCVALSRLIEGGLDRDKEDFDLEVSSPGVESEFVVKEQYIKNRGREVKVTLNDGIEKRGILTQVNDDNIELELLKKEKVEGKKKKQLIKERIKLNYNNIKSARVILKI